MAKFEVEIKSIEVYHVPVEADDESEAIEKALEKYEEDKSLYHHDSEGEEMVYCEGELI